MLRYLTLATFSLGLIAFFLGIWQYSLLLASIVVSCSIYYKKLEFLIPQILLLYPGRWLIGLEAFLCLSLLLTIEKDSLMREVKIYIYASRPRHHLHLILGGGLAILLYVPLVIYLSVGLEALRENILIYIAMLLFIILRALLDYLYYLKQRDKPYGEPNKISLFLMRHIFELLLLVYYIFFITAFVGVAADLLGSSLPEDLSNALEDLLRFLIAMLSLKPRASIAYLLAFLFLRRVKPYRNIRYLKEEGLKGFRRLSSRASKVAIEETSEKIVDALKDALLGLSFLGVFFVRHLPIYLLIPLAASFLLYLRIDAPDTLEAPEVKDAILYAVITLKAIPDAREANKLVEILSSPLIEYSLVVTILGIFAHSLAEIFFENLVMLVVPYAIFLYYIYQELFVERAYEITQESLEAHVI